MGPGDHGGSPRVLTLPEMCRGFKFPQELMFSANTVILIQFKLLVVIAHLITFVVLIYFANVSVHLHLQATIPPPNFFFSSNPRCYARVHTD